jgi:hypothetical protein
LHHLRLWGCLRRWLQQLLLRQRLWRLLHHLLLQRLLHLLHCLRWLLDDRCLLLLGSSRCSRLLCNYCWCLCSWLLLLLLHGLSCGLLRLQL